MKQIVTIFLSLLLLSSSGGMVLAKHYCGGLLVETALFEKVDPGCGGMEESGCCDTVLQDLRHNENTLVTALCLEPKIPSLLYTVEIPTLLQVFIQTHLALKKFIKTPLPILDILIQKQSFLI